MLATTLLFVGAFFMSTRIEWYALGRKAPLLTDGLCAIGICCLAWGIKLL